MSIALDCSLWSLFISTLFWGVGFTGNGTILLIKSCNSALTYFDKTKSFKFKCSYLSFRLQQCVKARCIYTPSTLQWNMQMRHIPEASPPSSFYWTNLTRFFCHLKHQSYITTFSHLTLQSKVWNHIVVYVYSDDKFWNHLKKLYNNLTHYKRLVRNNYCYVEYVMVMHALCCTFSKDVPMWMFEHYLLPITK